MEERKLEALEKLFPDGFLIVYPVKNGKAVRMNFLAPTDSEACEQIRRVWAIVKENEI